jgi:hypothetical protein
MNESIFSSELWNLIVHDKKLLGSIWNVGFFLVFYVFFVKLNWFLWNSCVPKGALVIRFIVTEPIHTCLNLIFDMGDVFTTNYSFNNMRHPHPRQLQTTIVTDFVNIKIKSIQSFRAAHFGRDVRACVNRGEYSCMRFYVYLYRISKKSFNYKS